MKKKVIAALLVIALLACCVAALAACNKNEGERKTEIVYLGDSIAEDILGASPLGLRHEYAYANVIGRRNDLTYYNHSVSGHLTKDLRAILENEDLDYDRARGLLLHVSEADIIHISILGNDVLQDRATTCCRTGWTARSRRSPSPCTTSSWKPRKKNTLPSTAF